MAYRSIPGERIRSIENPSSKKPCARCGRLRNIPTKRVTTGLCRDCLSVMTPEEIEKWSGDAGSQEVA